jgi:hypothetical protein
MHAEITRYPLDRIPLSLIIDDSTVLVNLNYFFMRDRNLADGENRRWEDAPVVHPESFTREFAEFCLEHGVRGKFSVVPCPAALGRIDEGLPLFSRAQQASWLAMCRELIVPAFDITPEMLTHTFVVDPRTCRPVEPPIWEQYEWETLPIDQEERVFAYIATACRILANVGLPPEGVTSPGGFGGRTLDFYARVAGEAVRSVTGAATPYFFKRVADDLTVETPVWYPNSDAGTAVGEIIASTGDWTGSWTGYGEADADRYITADLQGGRLPQLIDAGEPVVFCSHWQGFYGMHNEDRRGFQVLQTVVRRLQELDPHSERTQWLKSSAITNYACSREMATVSVEGDTISLDLPVRVPDLTLRITGESIAGVAVDGRPLRRAASRRDFGSESAWVTPEATYVAFTPSQQITTIALQIGHGT